MAGCMISENPMPSSAAFRLPALILIGANLIPLAGVLFWDWSLFQVVALYWLENVMLGALNLLRMLLSSPGREAFAAMQVKGRPAPALPMDDKAARTANNVMKCFLMPFFTVHYGIFCFVHGMFVFVLLGKDKGAGHGGMFSGLPALVEKAAAEGGLWAVAALAGSHLFSFVYHFLIGGEYRRTSAPLLMMAPYGRIVVLHIAILFGAFAIMALGSPIFLLILLVAGKTILDLTMHLRSHRGEASKKAGIPDL